MDPKEIGPRLHLVNPTIPARVQARSRADSRLQSMTLGAAALGIVATGVFGYAAALTYTGQTSTANAADQQTGFGGGTYGNGATANGYGQGTGGAVMPNGFNQVPVNPPTTTRHRQHVVSGGS